MSKTAKTKTKTKVYDRDDLKGHLVPVTNKFSSRILEHRYEDDGYTLGIVVDFEYHRVWMTDRFGRGQTFAESRDEERFYNFFGLGANNDERFHIARLIDKFLSQIGLADRDVSEEEKALIDVVCSQVKRQAYSAALAKLESATAAAD